MPTRILEFRRPDQQGYPRVGRVRTDGSIAFQGKIYRTIRDVPQECLALRPDLETHSQWVRLYRAIDPKQRHRRDDNRSDK
jgi:hypothetical protein